jgi:hypothetical protein
MVADLVYEFQMKCLRGTYIIEEKPKKKTEALLF